VSISEVSVAALATALTVGGAIAGDEPIPANPLIEIPAGEFVFGTDDGPQNERPSRLVRGQAFAMNRTEITNRQYRLFVEATGHRSSFYGNHPLLGLDERPVVGVSWGDADAFCAHYGLALPSEQQYERAARGIGGDPFPWGSAPPDVMTANSGSDSCCTGDDRDGYAMTAPAASFAEGASSEGVLNLVGNVWEWARDFYAPYKGEADIRVAGKFKVLRGGSWNSDRAHLTTTYRLAYDPDFRYAANGGFRCVRSGPQS
jgi:iron(II)-dependent oxidoreductase